MVKLFGGLVILVILVTGLVACGGASSAPTYTPTATPRPFPTSPAPVAKPVPPPLFSFTYYQQEGVGKILVRVHGQTLKQTCSPYCTFESEKEVLDWLSENIPFEMVGADKDTYVYVRSPFPEYKEMFNFLLQGDATTQSLYVSPGSWTPACPVGTERYAAVGPSYYCVGTPSSLKGWLQAQTIPGRLVTLGPPAQTISVVGPLTLKAP